MKIWYRCTLTSQFIHKSILNISIKSNRDIIHITIKSNRDIIYISIKSNKDIIHIPGGSLWLPVEGTSTTVASFALSAILVSTGSLNIRKICRLTMSQLHAEDPKFYKICKIKKIKHYTLPQKQSLDESHIHVTFQQTRRWILS